MTNSRQTFGRKGRIALALILAAASLLLLCSMGGLFASPSGVMPPEEAASYPANDSFVEEIAADMPADSVSYNVSYEATVLEWFDSSEVEEDVNGSVLKNDSLDIDAAVLVSCSCRTCKSDDWTKKFDWLTSTTTTTLQENSSTTTTLNGSVTTTTTTLPDNTTTTSVPVTTTSTTTLPGDTTTTTSVTSTTIVEDTTTTTSSTTTTTTSSTTTTTTSSTTTTTIPEADEFSSGWFALAILFFAPAFMYLAVKRS
jgi:hypothetical protein